MPDPQGYCEYAGYTNLIGGRYTESRGVQPGVFLLRMSAEPVLLPHIGTLKLFYDGEVREFLNCCNGPHVQRVWTGRNAYEWHINVYDKRWLWRYPRISGHYNTVTCNGLIDESTRKSMSELIGLLLDAMDEPQRTLNNIPAVYPEVDWEQAYAARELEWLCDRAGLVICPQPDGSILIEGLGQGASLPERDDNISPVYTYHQTVMPSHVQIRTGPSVFQSLINLKAIGLDIDGSWKLIDDLSYTPATGWSSQWYTTFADVDPQYRHLAFQTVWRYYRLHSQVGSTGVDELAVMKNLKILERLAETHPDDLGIGRCPDAVVKGVFWPLSDHKANTQSTVRYSGQFRVLPHLNAIAFEYPVIKWTTGFPSEATLQLYVAYNAVGANGEHLDELFVKQVTPAILGTAARVEKRHYLKRVRNYDAAYGQSGSDNLDVLVAEANAYLDPITDTYTGGPEKDMLYGGLITLGLSGKIAQIRYRWGNDRVATTRASENHEFDVTQKSHQERRRQERLGQLFDLIKESQ